MIPLVASPGNLRLRAVAPGPILQVADIMDTEQSPLQAKTDVERVAGLLLEAVPRLRRIISTAAQDNEGVAALTFTQLRVLGRLIHGMQLPSELARSMGITPATASGLVDLLVQRGLVARGDRPGDRRCTRLTVTPAGVACWEAAMARAIEALGTLLSEMEPSRRRALEDGLQALLALMPDRAARRQSGDHHVG